MSDLVPTGSSIGGLPVPPQEKITRWVVHGGIAALAVAAVIKFMPFVNNALSLLLTGFFSLTQILLVAGGLALGLFAVIQFWPVYKKLIESLANKATWSLLEYDPVTPMELWLKEVHADRQELEKQYGAVNGVIAQNEQIINDNLDKAKQGDKQFATAVKNYGQDSQQARMLSLEPGTLRESAQAIAENTKSLYKIRDILKQVVDATEYTETKAELDVRAFKQQYSSSQATERATNAATRVLRGRSERKADAMKSMQLIHDKYAGNFGRLQALRQLSQQLITSADTAKDTYYQEALDRFNSESRMITGGKPQPATLEAIPNGQANGVSFYSVQPSANRPVTRK